jgi:hypothetical protein
MQDEYSSPCLQKLTNKLYPGPLNPVQRFLNPILSNIHFNNILPSIPRFFNLLQYTYKSPCVIADYVQIMFSNCTWILITELIHLIRTVRENYNTFSWLCEAFAFLTLWHMWPASIPLFTCHDVQQLSTEVYKYSTIQTALFLKTSLTHFSKRIQMPLCNISMICTIKHSRLKTINVFLHLTDSNHSSLSETKYSQLGHHFWIYTSFDL